VHRQADGSEAEAAKIIAGGEGNYWKKVSN